MGGVCCLPAHCCSGADPSHLPARGYNIIPHAMYLASAANQPSTDSRPAAWALAGPARLSCHPTIPCKTGPLAPASDPTLERAMLTGPLALVCTPALLSAKLPWAHAPAPASLLRLAVAMPTAVCKPYSQVVVACPAAQRVQHTAQLVCHGPGNHGPAHALLPCSAVLLTLPCLPGD